MRRQAKLERQYSNFSEPNTVLDSISTQHQALAEAGLPEQYNLKEKTIEENNEQLPQTTEVAIIKSEIIEEIEVKKEYDVVEMMLQSMAAGDSK